MLKARGCVDFKAALCDARAEAAAVDPVRIVIQSASGIDIGEDHEILPSCDAGALVVLIKESEKILLDSDMVEEEQALMDEIARLESEISLATI